MQPEVFIAAGIEPFSKAFDPEPLDDYAKSAKWIAERLLHVYLEQRGAIECHNWLIDAAVVRCTLSKLVKIRQGTGGGIDSPKYRDTVTSLKTLVENLHASCQAVLALVDATYPAPSTRKHPEIVYPQWSSNASSAHLHPSAAHLPPNASSTNPPPSAARAALPLPGAVRAAL